MRERVREREESVCVCVRDREGERERDWDWCEHVHQRFHGCKEILVEFNFPLPLPTFTILYSGDHYKANVRYS